MKEIPEGDEDSADLTAEGGGNDSFNIDESDHVDQSLSDKDELSLSEDDDRASQLSSPCFEGPAPDLEMLEK